MVKVTLYFHLLTRERGKIREDEGGLGMEGKMYNVKIVPVISTGIYKEGKRGREGEEEGGRGVWRRTANKNVNVPLVSVVKRVKTSFF